MRWASDVARMGEVHSTRFWWESTKERDHSEDRDEDGRMDIRMDIREIG
jgi:hypothetical protein